MVGRIAFREKPPMLSSESAREHRARIQGYLEMADRHVLQGERHVRQQIALVRRLKEGGRDILVAKELSVLLKSRTSAMWPISKIN
jgi:hypothetical protein